MRRVFWGLTKLEASVALFVLFAVLLSFLAPRFNYHRRGPSGAGCMSNLRQVGMGLLMYAQDEGDRLPPPAAWADSVEPFVKNDAILRCPEVRVQNLGGYGYALNRHLKGTKLSSLESPREVPLVYDSTNLARHAADFMTSLPNPGRHQGRNHMVCADGSAKRLQDSETDTP